MSRTRGAKTQLELLREPNEEIIKVLEKIQSNLFMIYLTLVVIGGIILLKR